MHVNYNGNIFPADQPIFNATNRAFRYGDGLFETIRVFEGQMPFFQKHWERLTTGCRLLGFETPANFSLNFFEKEIAKLTNNNGSWRIRLSVWRSGGGLYTPRSNMPEFLIEATTLPNSTFELNEVGLVVCIFQKYLLPQTTPNYDHQPPSVPLPIKTNSALLQVLAAVAKKEAGLDDCLMLNTAGQLACASSSNLFWVENSALLTPPINAGALAGTMRATILDMAGQLGIRCNERSIGPNELAMADEIFLTNAIQGIRWVRQVKNIEAAFGQNMAAKLVEELNKRFIKNKAQD
jgi:branched-chain amino acid aminotransferase